MKEFNLILCSYFYSVFTSQFVSLSVCSSAQLLYVSDMYGVLGGNLWVCRETIEDIKNNEE